MGDGPDPIFRANETCRNMEIWNGFQGRGEKSCISNPIDSETCLHIHPLEGSLVWLHRPWSQSAPPSRGSPRPGRRQPSLGFLSVTDHNVTQKSTKKYNKQLQIP